MIPIEQFELECMQTLAKPGGIILDLGGGARFQKAMKKFEYLFAKCDYKTMDYSADWNPDIVGDIHAIPLPDASVDGVICRSVIEHIERPWDACKEIHRILKPGGYAFIQAPSIYPYHARTGSGAYPDYWRFFESSLRMMLQPFSQIIVRKNGGWFRVISLFLPFQSKLTHVYDPVAKVLDRWFNTEKRTNTPSFSIFVQK